MEHSPLGPGGLTERMEITTSQLASSLDSRLYDEHLSRRDIAIGCEKACRWGLASVIVRPSELRLAAAELSGSAVSLATVVGWNSEDVDPLHPVAVQDEAEVLAAAGASEIGVVATAPRLRADEGVAFQETLGGLVTAMGPWGVRVRLIVDTDSLAPSELRDACAAASAANVWMAQGGSWRGRRAGLTELQLMRAQLPRDILLKWTEPVRRLETMLLCMALGIDRFNADVDDVMKAATRAESLGPLVIPRAGVDF